MNASQIASKLRSTLKTSCVVSWPGKITFSIWTIGFLLMLSLTVKDFVPLVDDYVNNNVATQMNILTRPEFPNVAICLPSYSTLWSEVIEKVCSLEEEYLNGSKSMRTVCNSCEEMKNHSLDFWNHLDKKDIHCGDYYQGANAKWLARTLLNNGLSNYALNRSNSEWLQPVVSSFFLYFSLLYWIDMDIALGTVEQNLSGKLDNNFTNRELDDLFDFVRKAHQVSVNGGCSILSDNSEIPNSSTRSPLRLDSFTIINEKFCFPMPENFADKDFVCSYSRWPYSWDRFDQSVFEIHPSPSALISQFDDKLRTTVNPLYLTEKPLYSSGEKRDVSEHVYLSYSVNSKLIVNNRGCSKERYPAVCVAKLQVLAAIEHCGCVPFTFRNFRLGNQSGYPYCSAKLYDPCQKILRRSFNRAQEICVKKCEYTQDAWLPAKTKIEHAENDSEYPQFLVAFRASEKPYTEFSLIEKTTPEQFVSSVGGLINLYIGGSGLTVIALLLLFIEQCKLWYRPKRQNALQQQTNAIDSWRFLRMVNVFRTIGAVEDQSKTDNATEAIDRMLIQIEELTKQNDTLAKQIENTTKETENLKQDVASILRHQGKRKAPTTARVHNPPFDKVVIRKTI